MASIEKLVAQLRDAAGELIGRIKALDGQIADLHAQRSAILDGPVSKADYLAYVKESMKRQSARFAREMAGLIGRSPHRYGQLEQAFKGTGMGLNLPVLTANSAVPIVSKEAMYFYFGDVIVARLGDAIEALDWPSDAVPIAERRSLIAKVEADIGALQRERDVLVEQLEAAGISG